MFLQRAGSFASFADNPTAALAEMHSKRRRVVERDDEVAEALATVERGRRRIADVNARYMKKYEHLMISREHDLAAARHAKGEAAVARNQTAEAEATLEVVRRERDELQGERQCVPSAQTNCSVL